MTPQPPPPPRSPESIAADLLSVIPTHRLGSQYANSLKEKIVALVQSKQDEIEIAENKGENHADDDWLSAIQNLDWGAEVDLAEGVDESTEARQHIIGGIHEIVTELRTRAEKAEMEAKAWRFYKHGRLSPCR